MVPGRDYSIEFNRAEPCHGDENHTIRLTVSQIREKAFSPSNISTVQYLTTVQAETQDNFRVRGFDAEREKRRLVCPVLVNQTKR